MNEQDMQLAIKTLEDKAKEAMGETKKELLSEIDGLKSKLAEVETLKTKLGDATSELIEIKAELNAQKENAKTSYKNLGSEIKESMPVITKALKGESKLDLELKATQVPSDIGTREDYAQWLDNGTTRKPVRKTFMRSIFPVRAVTNEFIKYREEDVVTRDAKVVIACATSTHLTKKSWVTRTVQIKKVRDIADVCLDMVDDYSFVQGEVNQLVNESVYLKEDNEMFLGGSAEYENLDNICSEFSASNVLANFAASIKAPTIGDLAGIMASQIYTFGAQNAWKADYLVMNETDKIKYLHAKDANENYLFPTFVFGQSDMIAGLKVVTNPSCAPNTMYVFDSTKGLILQRNGISLTTSFENKDNVEHETATVVAFLRSQFMVKNIEKDAFMKCSNIATALVDITKV